MAVELKKSCDFTKEQLLAIKGEEPVQDFEKFWRAQYERAVNCKLDYKVEDEIWSPLPEIKIYKVSFVSCDGFKIGMWVSRPEKSYGGQIITQGYGNVVKPFVSKELPLTTAMPCVPGLGISMCKDQIGRAHV